MYKLYTVVTYCIAGMHFLLSNFRAPIGRLDTQATKLEFYQYKNSGGADRLLQKAKL